ncbi:MAG: FAD-dependent oxidoreductase, partial [Verrucomicrobiaceae bacterium]|nr:FAD-dependent oxidoreductase [Verrucomicrobiaceae bacterium]
VTMVGAETYPPYKRWLLSKDFLREKTPPLKKLNHLEAGWYDSHKIETRLGTIVTQFNIDRRLAVLGNGETIEFNKACLAMGSRPVRPPVAGVALGNVIYLRTTRDALALREMASLEKAIVVIGGGLLACEVASSLRQLKFKVSIMHRNAYLLNRYVDPETGGWLTTYFEKHGVTLLLGESLNGFEGKTVLRNIQTKSGNRVAAGVAVVACGAEANLELVRNTPLAGPHGSPVTEYLETEEKGIYAVGDLAFYPDRVMGGMRRQTHWENAREQGLVAGANITGKKRIRYEQLPYFWTEMPAIFKASASAACSSAGRRLRKSKRPRPSCGQHSVSSAGSPLRYSSSSSAWLRTCTSFQSHGLPDAFRQRSSKGASSALTRPLINSETSFASASSEIRALHSPSFSLALTAGADALIRSSRTRLKTSRRRATTSARSCPH